MTKPTDRHVALLVEDDPFYVEEISQVLDAIGCDVLVCDNKNEALRLFHENRLCLVVLDMSIRSTADSGKDRPSFGFNVLDELRRLSPHHNGVCWWLPIVATSAVVSATDDVVRVMRFGAATFVAKTISDIELSEVLTEELRRSGRDCHRGCFARPVPPGLPGESYAVRITGEEMDRRTIVYLGDCRIALTEGELHTLLKLAAHDGRGFGVHKSKLVNTERAVTTEIDANAEKGVSQQIERLRKALEPAAGERDVVENDGHGFYRLSPAAKMVSCDAAGIERCYPRLRALAQAVQRRSAGKRPRRKRK